MTEPITPSFIQTICKSLERGSQAHRRLPGGGLVHIDRPLPFLVLFRHPEGAPDHATADFVKAEASYIIAQEEQTPQLAQLIQEIAQVMSARFGAFLLLELFAAPASAKPQPDFQILGPQQALPGTLTVLIEELEKITVNGAKAKVTIESNQPLMEGPSRLFSEEELKKMSTLLLGIKLKPRYVNPATKTVYPLLQRTLRTKVADALKKTVFDFVRVQTTMEPTHFQALGRRAVVPAVWRIDKQLTTISTQIRFLLLVTPINAPEAWECFKKDNFQKAPDFRYRLMPIDADILKRELYNIPLEKVEDPTLAFLFRDKRHEVDKMLTMLADRNTPHFLYSSLQLFGGVDEDLLKVAEGILTALPHPVRQENIELIPVQEFAALARQEIAFLKEQYPGVDSGVDIRDDIVGLIVSEGRLNIGTNAQIPRFRAPALIQHEVGTHILTYFNGKAQPLQQLYVGVPGYEELQEGLAVLSEYLVGGLDHDRLRILAGRVVAVYHLTKGCGFTDNFSRLKEQYHFTDEVAFDVTMRVHRGGGLTKDAVYLKGLVHLLQYLKEGHDLAPLLIGKIKQEYLPIVQELIYRNVLRPAPLTPRYLSDPAVKPKLEQLKTGISVFNLI